MDNLDHTELLRLQYGELDGRTRFCPDDQVIAEYFDGDLPEAERLNLERHLTDCRFCLACIGLLERLAGLRDNRRIPEDELAAAKQMSHGATVRHRRRRISPAWAAAAVLVLAVIMVFNLDQDFAPDPRSTPSAPPSTGEPGRQLRSVNREVTDLNVLTPKPGADIIPGSLIQWAEVPGNLHYDIYVLSHAGDVLWSERMKGTEWVPNESLQLAAGNKYYFRVEAQLPDGRRVSSRHVAFRIAER